MAKTKNNRFAPLEEPEAIERNKVNLEKPIYIVSPYGYGYMIDRDHNKVVWVNKEKWAYDSWHLKPKSGCLSYLEAEASDGTLKLMHVITDAAGEEQSEMLSIPLGSSDDQLETYITERFIETHMEIEGNSFHSRVGDEYRYRISYKAYQIYNPYWHLKFMVCSGISIEDNSDFQVNDVYYCLTYDHFVEKLVELGMYEVDTIRTDMWLNTVKSVISLDHEYEELLDGMICTGVCLGCEVAVRVYPEDVVFSSKFIKFISRNTIDYVTVFRGVQKLDHKVLLAYDFFSLNLWSFIMKCRSFYLENVCLATVAKVNNILRCIVKCLIICSSYDICHTSFNPWNVGLTEDVSPRMLFDNCTNHTEIGMGIVRSRIARLISFCFNKNPALTEEEYNQAPVDPSTMLDWAVDAKDLVRVLTDTSWDINLVEVYFHPALWDLWSRCGFFPDGHEFLKHHIRGRPELAGTILTDKSYFDGKRWKDLLPNSVIACMMREDKGGNRPHYDWEHPMHLLRFVRNCLVHHQDVVNEAKYWRDQTVRYFFGPTPVVLEHSFRLLFPCIMPCFYNLIKDIEREERTALERYYRLRLEDGFEYQG